jgi:regulator of protease activity HflC (stomatin/prohibitin superfamily)
VLTAWWAGAVPGAVAAAVGLPVPPGAGLGPLRWAAYAGTGALGLFGFGGLTRGRTGRALVLGLFGRYRGTVRRTGLLWVNPLFLRRRVDIRLRHWRSEPMAGVDSNGVALRVVVLVAWRVRDTARAVLGVEDHEQYLRECVEAALSRVLSRLPADVSPTALVKDATLRNTEAVGESLTRLVAADAAAVGLEVYSAQPTRIEYAPEVAAVMQRRRIAALDAQHRDTVLTSVVDSVEDTVTRLTMRGLVELDDYERKALVKDLTVAFYTGRREALP